MNEYAKRIRRQLHMYPEIGFNLDRTLTLLRNELDAMGIEYTEAYGKSSIVATINPEKTNFTIGIRADTDALPIREVAGREYGSRIDGQMHACGHDAHTAIALATAKKLQEIRDQINCRVKILFQSAEEYPPSGAKLMVADGAMEDIDCIVALHCDPAHDAGTVALGSMEQNAVSHGFYLHFYGRSSHVANQQEGVDAILMAVRACTALEMTVAKEIRATTPVVFNVGSIHGGEANNVICDHCVMFCTLRTWQGDTDAFLIQRFKDICQGIAQSAGGRFEFEESKYYPVLVNDPLVTERLRAAAVTALGEDHVHEKKTRGMGAEDFSYMCQEKPGAIMRLGIRNQACGITSGLHHDDFDVDEAALETGVNVFVQFVIDNLNGIPNLPSEGHRA
ncbi:MAG: amidohydrolase [Clostridia bacterium]|nr:amidohydrolase [Clostridia bacterium]